MRNFFMDNPWWLNAILICGIIVALGCVVVLGIDLVNEVNEPTSGEIYDLKFIPAHTTYMPVTHSFPDGRGGFTYYQTTQAIYNPDSYMVYYHQWDNEKNKWLNGDCGVDAQTFHSLKIGQDFENIN